MCKEKYNGPNRAVHLNGPCPCRPTCRGSGRSMARHNGPCRPGPSLCGPGCAWAGSNRAVPRAARVAQPIWPSICNVLKRKPPGGSETRRTWVSASCEGAIQGATIPSTSSGCHDLFTFPWMRYLGRLRYHYYYEKSQWHQLAMVILSQIVSRQSNLLNHMHGMI
jgi:hypothetical protein